MANLQSSLRGGRSRKKRSTRGLRRVGRGGAQGKNEWRRKKRRKIKGKYSKG
jgi:hypothetical protein